MSAANEELDQDERFDAIVIGAGFAGLYALYRLREAGLRVRVYEAGDGVGGTWYWNRYPGARCDAESLAYSFSFSPELEQEWEWTERYATQPEILRYIEHVAERFDLLRDIRLERRVSVAHYDDESKQWNIRTEQGDRASAPICIMATGCLSVPKTPDVPGVDAFEGPTYLTGLWPHEGVDLSGKRVGVIGTGSSAIQAIPVMAEQAETLTVFQRTPNFSVPAHNHPLEDEFVQKFKPNYREHRRFHKLGLSGGFGDTEIEPKERMPAAESVLALSDAEFNRICEDYWATGGARFLAAIADTMLNDDANLRVAGFVHQKIQSVVKDPATARALCPTSHPIGSKRICVDIGYFETYNRENVRLVDLTKAPIERVTADGIQIAGGIQTTDEHIPLDALVLATGFDAMTGALLRVDIRGAGGQRLSDKWSAGPQTYLGLMVAGFPNFFTITGPGSPSVLSNMIVSIEQHVDFIMDCLAHMKAQGVDQVDADLEAEAGWMNHVAEVANATLMPKGGSWYLGANVPGKPRVFMPYAAGVGIYREVCEQIVADGYRGFVFAKTGEAV
jgi:cyclohexanone monooxygenase